jgi:hypothetical protein
MFGFFGKVRVGREVLYKHKMSSFFSQLNESSYLVSYVSVKTLTVNEKNKIISFNKVNTKFGEKVVVECDNFKTLLPERYTYDWETCLSSEPRSSGKNNKFRISGRMKRKEKLNAVYKHKLSLYLKSLNELSSLINMYEMRKTMENLKLN